MITRNNDPVSPIIQPSLKGIIGSDMAKFTGSTERISNTLNSKKDQLT
jgi:hypothetical protein